MGAFSSANPKTPIARQFDKPTENISQALSVFGDKAYQSASMAIASNCLGV